MDAVQRLRVYRYYLPVFFWVQQQLEQHKAAHGGAGAPPLVLGISAPQGCGKSTLVEQLEALFTWLGTPAASVSIDDFYLTHAGQAALAAAHPDNRLLALRGNAGSHDLALGSETLRALRALTRAGDAVAVPRYDKSAHGGRGDRADPATWPRVAGPLELVFFEGWMSGFAPVGADAAAAVEPALAEVDAALAAYGDAWDALVDSWLVIRIADPQWVFGWRLQAEQRMRAAGKPGMSDEGIADFVSRYIPAYTAYLPGLYARGPTGARAGRTLVIEDPDKLQVQRHQPPHTPGPCAPTAAALLACLLLLRPATVAGQGAAQVVAAGLYSRSSVLMPSPADAATEAWAEAEAQVEEAQGAAAPQFWQMGVSLPACPASGLLASEAAGFPPDWASLPPSQQAAHPANALAIQLAYTAWQDDPARDMGACLGAAGVDVGSLRVINARVAPHGGTMSAVVARAGARGVFVAFRGTDFADPGDVLVDADCAHTPNLRRLFSDAPGPAVRLHGGFAAAWAALEADVLAAVTAELAQVDAAQRVYLIGHSLGGALAAIGALRLRHVFAQRGGAGEVAGVWLFGCPRVGDAGWQREYDAHLLSRTLRMSNYADFAARLPAQAQACPLTHADGTTFGFRHVGRSLVLCPNPRSGLVDWALAPRGSETLSCGILADLPDLSVTTHWLGSYLDAWRRGFVAATGRSPAADPRLANVACSECSRTFMDRAAQANLPARAGGPVACSVSASCSRADAWDAAAALGGGASVKRFNPFSVCLGYQCT
ncbi:hypothetical protein HT031_005784 [Scenedesmus sp. PABB004]|nr:hypothetical protein HT031_005784 [Scenedesmus sp. PABB004]